VRVGHGLSGAYVCEEGREDVLGASGAFEVGFVCDEVRGVASSGWSR
jgi:hypothetical protein